MLKTGTPSPDFALISRTIEQPSIHSHFNGQRCTPHNLPVNREYHDRSAILVLTIVNTVVYGILCVQLMKFPTKSQVTELAWLSVGTPLHFTVP